MTSSTFTPLKLQHLHWFLKTLRTFGIKNDTFFLVIFQMLERNPLKLQNETSDVEECAVTKQPPLINLICKSAKVQVPNLTFLAAYNILLTLHKVRIVKFPFFIIWDHFEVMKAQFDASFCIQNNHCFFSEMKHFHQCFVWHFTPSRLMLFIWKTYREKMKIFLQ